MNPCNSELTLLAVIHPFVSILFRNKPYVPAAGVGIVFFIRQNANGISLKLWYSHKKLTCS